MTTMTAEKLEVQVLVDEMVKLGIMHTLPHRESNEKLYNEQIEEIVIDEEGNVFLALIGAGEMVFPALVPVDF